MPCLRTKKRSRPALEFLEDRAIPTVLFAPYYASTAEYAPAGKTIAQDRLSSLMSPSVVLIFSGSSWTTPTGMTNQKNLTTAVQGLLGTNYLSDTAQYGTDGKALYYKSFQDNATPIVTGQMPTASDLLTYIQAEIKGHPGPVPTGNNVIYMVVNDPNDSLKSLRTYGYNSYDGATQHTAYVGAVNNASGVLDQDGFTQVFSHELAEAMTVAVHVTNPGHLSKDDQIADNEPELIGNGYTYRLSNGILVQAYWSQKDLAWAVPDGNSQTLTLLWATPNFNNTYLLDVGGDQMGGNYGDSIIVDRGASNALGTRVIENGQSTSFDPGEIKSVSINTYGGYDAVAIKGVESGETVSVDSTSRTSFDDVVVGSNGSLSAIQGTISVANTSGKTWLQIDDSHDTARNITISNGSVAFQGLPTIYFTPYTGPFGFASGVMGLEIDDTFAANQINVLSVPMAMPVMIEGNPLDNLFGPAAGSVGLNRNGYRYH